MQHRDALASALVPLRAARALQIDAVRFLAARVYGPDVDVEINGENFHYEARNIMKLAAMLLDSPQDASGVPGSEASMVDSGAGSPPLQLLAQSAQSEVADVVERMVAGGFQADMTAELSRFGGVTSEALLRLQARLCELHGMGPPASSPVVRAPPCLLSCGCV
jgi:hypothetical protein